MSPEFACDACGHPPHEGKPCNVKLEPAGAPGSEYIALCNCGGEGFAMYADPDGPPPADENFSIRAVLRNLAKAYETVHKEMEKHFNVAHQLQQRLDSTVAQSEHFQSELRRHELAVSILTNERMMAFAEMKRQEDVINGGKTNAVLEALAATVPVQLGSHRITFKKEAWARLVAAIRELRP